MVLPFSKNGAYFVIIAPDMLFCLFRVVFISNNIEKKNI